MVFAESGWKFVTKTAIYSHVIKPIIKYTCSEGHLITHHRPIQVLELGMRVLSVSHLFGLRWVRAAIRNIAHLHHPFIREIRRAYCITYSPSLSPGCSRCVCHGFQVPKYFRNIYILPRTPLVDAPHCLSWCFSFMPRIFHYYMTQYLPACDLINPVSSDVHAAKIQAKPALNSMLPGRSK